MKNNGPVTNIERFLEPGRPIVSKTDLKGLITYVNESFVRVSGFSREELLGKSHNIVRHPDMPPEAFADLWTTIQAGQPWRGLVKNRAKTGDHYWVEAFVTPLTENGVTVGYMSVRNAPARAEVEAAEALYRQVRQRQATLPATRLAGGGAHRVNLMLLGACALLAPAAGLLGGPWGLAAGGLAALLALVSLWYAQGRMAPELARLSRTIRDLDEGQLGRKIETGGPLAQQFVHMEAMRIHLRAMFADVLVSAREVEARSRRLDEAMQVLVENAGTQGERVMEVAAAMEQMSVSINEVSRNTEHSRDAVLRTGDSARAGMASMSTSMDSSRQVVAVVEQSQSRIAEVDAAVARIGQVTGIIRDVAEQTNLLALNAAIEAARAGDQGRGFAVVADEVRKLAERTASSTVEISAAVNDIAQLAAAAVDTMNHAVHDVACSTQRVEESSHSLEEILAVTREASLHADDIVAMLQQQSAASHEVANHMERISSAVESSNASIASVGQDSRDLRATADELHLLLEHLEGALR